MKSYFCYSLLAATLYAYYIHELLLLLIVVTPLFVQICRISWQIVAKKPEEWDKF